MDANKRAITANREDLAIVMIDVQPFFLEGWMAGSTQATLTRLKHLLGLSNAYELQVLATFEQPVETKGWLPGELEAVFPSSGIKMTKNTFNCCGEPEIVEALTAMGRKQLAVAGGETDVCVLQSVLGMIRAGYEIFLLEDCLFSSEPHTGPAIRRMEQAGAIPTTVKTLSYELRLSVEHLSEQRLLDNLGLELKLGASEALPEWSPGT